MPEQPEIQTYPCRFGMHHGPRGCTCGVITDEAEEAERQSEEPE
jgi:hypothetical protein